MRLKSLFAVSLLLIACKDKEIPGPDVKIYISKPEVGGLVRDSGKDVVLYQDSENYFAMSEPDFEVFLNWCKNPKQSEIVSFYIKQRVETFRRASYPADR